MNNEIADLRKRKLSQMQSMFNGQMAAQSEENEMAEQISQLEAQVKPLMTNDALSRYSTIKTAHPEVAIRALVALARLMQSGKLNSIDDIFLRSLLVKLTSQKKEYNILK